METPMPDASPILSSTMNLGSGKDFRADCFNVDVDDSWTPDVVLDLSIAEPGDGGLVLDTRRFGRVVLRNNSFDRIIANDVLEHVPALTRLMTTCLGLLRAGGIFEISVPYDLSFGAWQDPTHVRAFNERSWLYYTDWFWYLGWSESRFHLDGIKFVLSPSGRALMEKGVSQDVVLTTPRAVDSMSVALRKIDLSSDDRATWKHWRERRRQAGIANAAAPAAALS